MYSVAYMVPWGRKARSSLLMTKSKIFDGITRQPKY